MQASSKKTMLTAMVMLALSSSSVEAATTDIMAVDVQAGNSSSQTVVVDLYNDIKKSDNDVGKISDPNQYSISIDNTNSKFGSDVTNAQASDSVQEFDRISSRRLPTLRWESVEGVIKNSDNTPTYNISPPRPKPVIITASDIKEQEKRANNDSTNLIEANTPNITTKQIIYDDNDNSVTDKKIDSEAHEQNAINIADRADTVIEPVTNNETGDLTVPGSNDINDSNSIVGKDYLIENVGVTDNITSYDYESTIGVIINDTENEEAVFDNNNLNSNADAKQIISTNNDGDNLLEEDIISDNITEEGVTVDLGEIYKNDEEIFINEPVVDIDVLVETKDDLSNIKNRTKYTELPREIFELTIKADKEASPTRPDYFVKLVDDVEFDDNYGESKSKSINPHDIMLQINTSDLEGISDEVKTFIIAGEFYMRLQLTQDNNTAAVVGLSILLKNNNDLTRLQKIDYLIGFGRAINRSNLSNRKKSELIKAIANNF